MSGTKIIELEDGETLDRIIGSPPLFVRLHWWLIRKVVGRTPVLMNLEIKPHHRSESDQEVQIMNCTGGLLQNVSITARHGCGITIKGKSDDQ